MASNPLRYPWLMPSLLKSLEYILHPPNLIQSFWKKPVQAVTEVKVMLVLPLSCIRTVWSTDCLQKGLCFASEVDDVLCWWLYVTNVQVPSLFFLLRKGRGEERKKKREKEREKKKEREKDKQRKKKKERLSIFGHGNTHFSLCLLEGWAQGEYWPEATRLSHHSKDFLEEAR